jgi:hypothetical protein
MIVPRDLAIPLQRVTWRDGQMLRSEDLRDSAASFNLLRRLHIRYLHRTWGVVEGLNVAANQGIVRVNRGYALDIDGCELLVPAITIAPVPPHTSFTATMHLVISRGAPSLCASATPDLAALCPGVVTALQLEKGALAWKTVRAVQLGHDVLLARARVVGGQVTGAIDTSVQQHAATMLQPRIWADTTLPGQTGWTDTGSNIVPGILAIIDTSDAGFLSPPAYVAQLNGPSQAVSQSISSAGSAGFTFQLSFPASISGTPEPNAQQAEAAGWTITWFAAELTA